MKMKNAITVALAAVIVVFSASAILAQGEESDKIVMNNGEVKEDLKVQSEDYLVVKYKFIGVGGIQTIPAAKVNRVEYADSPTVYSRAMTRFKKKAFQSALTDFEGALEKARGKKDIEWAVQYCMYYIPLCKFGLASTVKEGRIENLESAIAGFQELLKQFPKTRFYPEALNNLGIAQFDLAIEKNDKALLAAPKKTFELMGKFCKTYDGYESMLLKAKIRLSEMLIEAKQFSEAAAALKDVVREAKNLIDEEKPESKKYKELKETLEEAQIGIIRCYRLDGDISGAKRAIEDLLSDKNTSTKVKALCHNEMGNIRLNHDKKEEDAIFDYLTVLVLFKNEDEALPDAHFGAARCFQLMYEKSGKRDVMSKKRAIENYKKVAEEFPGARCASQAEIFLGELGK